MLASGNRSPHIDLIMQDTVLAGLIDAALEAEGWTTAHYPDAVTFMAILPPVITGLRVVLAALPADVPYITAIRPALPVIALVNSQAAAIDEALSAGAADYVTQPLHLPTLIFRIRHLMRNAQTDEQLRLNQQLLTQIGDAVVVVDADHRVLFISKSAEVLFNLSLTQVQGQSLHTIYRVVWKDDTASDAARANVYANGAWREEVEIVLHDGRRLFVDALIRVWKDGQGRVNGLIGTLRDITDRKRSEEGERNQRVLANALRETASALTRALDPQNVMQLILEYVGRVVPHRAANIMLMQREVLRPVHLHGYSEPARRVMETQLFKPTDRLFTEMMNSAVSSTLLSYAPDHPDWRVLPHLEWIQSYLGTPIRAYEHVIGFLNLYSDKPSAFTDQDAANLRAFADQAAIAIENAQLYDAIFRDAVEMRALHRATSFLFTADLVGAADLSTVTLQIAAAVVREFAKVDCGVFLTEEGGKTLQRFARAGDFQTQMADEVAVEAPTVLGAVVRGGRSIYVRDCTAERRYPPLDLRIRSQLVIPLKALSRNAVIGVLDLQSTEVDAFTAQDQRMLQAFAERVSASLENIRLYQNIQQRVDERTAELTRVKERVEAILNHSSDAIVMLHPDGTIGQANRTFGLLMGVTDDAAFGRPLADFFVPAHHSAFLHTLDTVFAAQIARRLELTVQPASASQPPIDVDVSISPIRHVGTITGAVISLRDITDRKRFENDLRSMLTKERELNALRSDFIARASHAFRTPLAVIQTSGDLLTRYLERLTPEQRQSRAVAMHAAIRQIIDLLDDLLLISRSEADKRVKFRRTRIVPADLCRDLMAGLVREYPDAPARIIHQPHEPGRMLHADVELFGHIVTHLVVNALKYSPPGTPVTLTTAFESDTFTLTVQDRGIGIVPADLPLIYEPFFRGQNVEYVQGTGLGLTIVKDCVDLHAGQVMCVSTPEQGTRFIVTLPVIVMTDDATGAQNGKTE